MWKLTQPPKTLKATRRLAQEFADMDPAPHDRPLSERRLAVYEKIMKEGGFRPVSWASATCGETNGLYRVNGKHTSVLLSRIDELPELHVVVERYHCDTLDDVARLYATYDSRIQSRTVSDINRTFAACVPELDEVPGRVVNKVISAVCYHRDGEQYMNARQPVERAEEILDNVGFCLWVSHLVGGTSNGRHHHIFRVPVVSAMYGSYKKSQADASKFWEAVRDETGASPSLPDRKLARFLLTNAPVQSRSDKPRRFRVGDKELYVKCIHAWNAWRRGESTNLQYHADADAPAFR